MTRKQKADALDTVLDTLGSQAVPPDFYLTSPVSSLFGSQNGSDDEHEDGRANGSVVAFQPGASPTETLRAVQRNGIMNGLRRARAEERSTWKTLRDFVDEQAIEDMLDTLDSDRNVLDVCPYTFKPAWFAQFEVPDTCRTSWQEPLTFQRR